MARHAPAGTQVEIFTRSGNTRTPDEAWSEWSAPYANAEGSPITSPKARYLQWRAVLTGTGSAAPALTSVSSAYLPRNIRPQVVSITVHPPGVVFQKPFSSGETEIAGLDEDAQERRAGNQAAGGGGAPALGRRIFQKGLQTFAWKAEDDNNDELSYDVFYRREGDTTWRLLKSDLRDTLLVWDTSSVPNGTYVLKVLASDRRANPAETALGGELESSSFDIDNVAPPCRSARSAATARASSSPSRCATPIRRCHASNTRSTRSAGRPRSRATASSTRGRSRSRCGSSADAAGRTLVIRATDALGNVGTGQVRFVSCKMNLEQPVYWRTSSARGERRATLGTRLHQRRGAGCGATSAEPATDQSAAAPCARAARCAASRCRRRRGP